MLRGFEESQFSNLRIREWHRRRILMSEKVRLGLAFVVSGAAVVMMGLVGTASAAWLLLGGKRKRRPPSAGSDDC